MARLGVRDLPEEVLSELRAEARKRHASLNSLACAALEEYVQRLRRQRELQALLPQLEDLRNQILARRGGQPVETDSVDLIRADRER